MIAPKSCPSVAEWLARYQPGLPPLTEDVKEWLRPLFQPVPSEVSTTDTDGSVTSSDNWFAIPTQRDRRSR